MVICGKVMRLFRNTSTLSGSVKKKIYRLINT